MVTLQGKYQIAAELKDKEMNNLKEELKSLQVFDLFMSQTHNLNITFLISKSLPLWVSVRNKCLYHWAVKYKELMPIQS